MATTVDIIQITPTKIVDPNKIFEIDQSFLTRTDESVCQSHTERTHYLVSIDNQALGYTMSSDFALQIVKHKFETIMRDLYRQNGTDNFQIKCEKLENDAAVYKLYYVSIGRVWTSNYKLATMTVTPIHRLSIV